MTIEEALSVLDKALSSERFNDTQELVFRQCWMGRSYHDIAIDAGYDEEYIKYVGSRIWKKLSQAFGEKVTKKNIQSVLRRHKRQPEKGIIP